MMRLVLTLTVQLLRKGLCAALYEPKRWLNKMPGKRDWRCKLRWSEKLKQNDLLHNLRHALLRSCFVHSRRRSHQIRVMLIQSRDLQPGGARQIDAETILRFVRRLGKGVKQRVGCLWSNRRGVPSYPLASQPQTDSSRDCNPNPGQCESASRHRPAIFHRTKIYLTVKSKEFGIAKLLGINL